MYWGLKNMFSAGTEFQAETHAWSSSHATAPCTNVLSEIEIVGLSGKTLVSPLVSSYVPPTLYAPATLGNTTPSTSMRKYDPAAMGSEKSTCIVEFDTVPFASTDVRSSPLSTVTVTVESSNEPPSGSWRLTDEILSSAPAVASHVRRVATPPSTEEPPLSFERAVARETSSDSGASSLVEAVEDESEPAAASAELSPNHLS